jgi:hypothetical protein
MLVFFHVDLDFIQVKERDTRKIIKEMSENLTTIIITTISVLGGAGGWKFYEFLIRNKREKQKEDKSEQTIYRDDLIARVERLERDKDGCTDSLMEVKAKAAALEVKVEFLERELDRIKSR